MSAFAKAVRTPSPVSAAAANSAVTGSVRRILQIEGFAAFAAATMLYAHLGLSWWLYALAFLVPDLSFAAYLAGRKVGAWVYNFAHSSVGAIALALYGYLSGASLALALALIWIAHLGADRLLGFGLKYPTSFQDTHLGWLGGTRS